MLVIILLCNGYFLKYIFFKNIEIIYFYFLKFLFLYHHIKIIKNHKKYINLNEIKKLKTKNKLKAFLKRKNKHALKRNSTLPQMKFFYHHPTFV